MPNLAEHTTVGVGSSRGPVPAGSVPVRGLTCGSSVRVRRPVGNSSLTSRLTTEALCWEVDSRRPSPLWPNLARRVMAT